MVLMRGSSKKFPFVARWCEVVPFRRAEDDLVDDGPLCGPAKRVGGPTKLAPFLVIAPASSLESLFSA